MYLSFYGLRQKPFQNNADPSFLWLGEKHEEALAILKYGILENQGFILLTGDVGTGKTTLINALTESLGDEVIVARVPDPGMEIIDFMNFISHTFKMKKKFSSKDAFLIHFGHFLNSTHAAGKKTLLIIDEAQRLKGDLLEEVRQLSNIEKQDTKLLNIFFVGQNEFNDVLLENKNRALRQRIAVNYNIDPLDLDETGHFIRHRLKVAGAENDIFSTDAINSVFEYSRGFPRRINIICDHSLLSGFVQREKVLTGEMVKECAEDLRLPVSSENDRSESQETIETAGAENLQELPAEDHQEVSSRSGWKTAFIAVLIVMALGILSYFKYPGEYRKFLSRFDNSEAQIGEGGSNRLTADSRPEADQLEVFVKGLETAPETGDASGDKDQDEQVTVESLVENVQPVTVKPEESPESQEPPRIVADQPDEESLVPAKEEDDVAASSFDSTLAASSADLDQQNKSSEEEKQETAAISETISDEKVEKGADLARVEKAGGIDNQDKAVLDFESSEKEIKETESDELPEIQISGENQEEVTKTESADTAVSPDTEEETNNKISVVVKEESEVALTETVTEAGQVEDTPDTERVEQPAVIPEVADTQVIQPYSVKQQQPASDEETETKQAVSESVESLGSETIPVQNDQEGVKAVLVSEPEEQLSNAVDVEEQTAGVIDTRASDVLVANTKDLVEDENNDAAEVIELEEDAVQASSSVQQSEPTVAAQLDKPVESTEDDKSVAEESGSPDPGALIDWVIKKRSE